MCDGDQDRGRFVVADNPEYCSRRIHGGWRTFICGRHCRGGGSRQRRGLKLRCLRGWLRATCWASPRRRGYAPPACRLPRWSRLGRRCPGWGHARCGGGRPGGWVQRCGFGRAVEHRGAVLTGGGPRHFDPAWLARCWACFVRIGPRWGRTRCGGGLARLGGWAGARMHVAARA